MVLPGLVDVRPCEEHDEEEKRRDGYGHPGAGTHPARKYPSILTGSMKIVLPDASELELPEGATGLDAARRIGPKLAEQAVLARVNGAPRDLRLPLADGESVQFLTTRDADDPDALYVLRHSTAHLLAEAVLRLHPGLKI